MDGCRCSEFLQLLYCLGSFFFELLDSLCLSSLLLFSEWARSTARKVTMSQALRIPTSRSNIIAEPTIYSAGDGFFGSTDVATTSKALAKRGNAIYQSQSSNVD